MTTMNRDWTKIAKLAGQHGITYPTNGRMDEFLTSLSEATGGNEPIGYCIWISPTKLAACAKRTAGSFPVYAAPRTSDEA